jgi:class 3 adenylate cyclase
MNKELQKMKKWAAYNPVNFLHKQLLMEAELYQSADDAVKAAAWYDKAIETANKNQWPADEAFANELAAKFYTTRGMDKAASGYWREAYYLYELQGAAGKTRFLKTNYPEHFKTFKTKPAVAEDLAADGSIAGHDSGDIQSLDVAAITRSSQAISEEIVLESLLGKMMRIIMMNAGAEKGLLLLDRHDKLYIQASGDGEAIYTMQNIPVKESVDLPQTIINYVTHLREPVVLDDAGNVGDFINDKYIREEKPKSVLCSPIVLLNKLYGIIYLENNISIGAFTKERLHTLQLLSSQMAISIQNAMMYAHLEDEVQARTIELSREKKKSDDLLFNILPEGVANELKSTGSAEAKQFDNTTVLFTDFVNFTKISESLTPKQLVAEVHACFTAFDTIMDKYGLEKIKTIGDAYLAVCGLPQPHPEHAVKAVNAALEILSFVKARKENGGLFDIRIGISSGPVVAGIVGVKKFVYDIWSDTVNTAARMESNSAAGKINISATTYELVQEHFMCSPRPVMHVKSKGLVEMYFVEGKR